MDLVPADRASARSDEPEARSDARWRVRAAAAGGESGAATVDGAATLTAPALAAFTSGDGGDDEGGGRVSPPPTEGGVEGESDEECGGEVGAQQVLSALAVSGVRVESSGDGGFGAGEQRHRDQRDDREADPDRAAFGVIAAGEGDGRVDRDVCGEQPEGDRDQLLGVSFGVFGLDAGVVEAPQDDDPGERFDQRVRAERDQRDRPGDDAGTDRHGRLDAVPREPEAGEVSRASLEQAALGPGVGAGTVLGRCGVDDGELDGHELEYVVAGGALVARWPELGRRPLAVRWLGFQHDLGRSPRTVDAYARSLVDFVRFCDRQRIDVVDAGRGEIAAYVRDLRERPGGHGANVIALDSGAGLSVATLQLRVTVVRLFYDFLVEERIRDRNPVGRGYRSADGRAGRRGLVGRMNRLPWIPTDAQWRALLEVAAGESVRNRLMLALAYDAGLRREELCLIGTDDLDPAHRMITVRAETTKSRRSRVVPYSEVSGRLLAGYLRDRRQITAARGALFVSESPRNRGAGVSPWTWSKVVRSIAVRAGVPAFSTHTLRHLCLTDLARSGWEISQIASFAGHRSTDTTQRYVHLSGRDLAARLESGMSQIHAQRIAHIGEALA
jgi:integrase/recombinase XerD